MFYINVQALDYDDYPRGSAVKIGPFETDTQASVWLENSKHFYQHQIAVGWWIWKDAHAYGNHSVDIREITSGLMAPERYEELYG